MWGPSRCLSCCGLLLAGSQIALAQDKVWFAGSEGTSDNHYSYLGVVQPVEGAKLGEGRFYRTTASWLTYRYDTVLRGSPATVRARSPGVEVAVGQALRGGDVWRADFSLGLAFRRTDLTPDDPGSRARGTRVALVPQAAGSWRFAEQLQAEGLSSLAIGNRSGHARVRLAWVPSSRWRIGGEAAQSEGPDYRDRRAGVFAAADVGAGLDLTLSAGRARDREGRDRNYAGLALARVF